MQQHLQSNLANLSELYIITHTSVLERFWQKRFWKKTLKTWKQRQEVKRAARMSGTNNKRLDCLDPKQLLLHCACCMLFGTKRDYTVLFSPSLNIICSRLVTDRLPSFMCFGLDSLLRQILRILSLERSTDLISNSLRSTRNSLTDPTLWVAYSSPPVQQV